MNKRIIYFFIINIILNPLLLGNELGTEDSNPFVNRPNYLEILKIKPNVILDEAGKPNLLYASKKLKEDLLGLNTIKLNGYYGILFNNEKILLFTSFSKDDNIYKSFLLTEQIILNVKFSEKSRNYLKMDIDIKYRHDKFEEGRCGMLGFNGFIPLIDNTITLRHFEQNIYFVIYKLP